MPMMPPRACATCRELVVGPCPTCTRTADHTYDRRRGTATARGYGARWRKYRAWFLTEYPICGDRPDGAPMTADSGCQVGGLPRLARVVDHIIPVTGPDDPTFYKPEAHQALCASCHDRKRARESRGGWLEVTREGEHRNRSGGKVSHGQKPGCP